MTVGSNWPGANELPEIPSAATVERVVWVPGQLEFTTSTIISTTLPPDHLITSVRCVVLNRDRVLVLTERDGTHHIIPGGRREMGESYGQTARREVLEETALALTSLAPLGYLVFDHLYPKPVEYAYPYPRFIQLVYVAHTAPDADLTCNDEWAISAAFIPQADARPLLRTGQQRLLEAAYSLSPRTAR